MSGSLAESGELARPENWMTLEVPSLADNVGLCRVAVAAFASALPFTLPEIEELKVAVSEAVSNCVIHAYGAEAPGRVAVRALRRGGDLEIEVEDWGRGIADVEQARRASFTTSTDPEHLGLGFTFMEQFSDRVEVVSRLGAGTTVRLHKRPHG